MKADFGNPADAQTASGHFGVVIFHGLAGFDDKEVQRATLSDVGGVGPKHNLSEYPYRMQTVRGSSQVAVAQVVIEGLGDFLQGGCGRARSSVIDACQPSKKLLVSLGSKGSVPLEDEVKNEAFGGPTAVRPPRRLCDMQSGAFRLDLSLLAKDGKDKKVN